MWRASALLQVRSCFPVTAGRRGAVSSGPRPWCWGTPGNATSLTDPGTCYEIGRGKTTLTSLFVRHLAGQGVPMVAIDAEINQHLGEALGAGGAIPAIGEHLAEIKEYLRGGNPRIASAAVMVKTTPPGRGSRLLRPGGTDPVHGLAIPAPCGAMLMATGPFSDDDLGVSCYHAKTGAVELYLNHLVGTPGSCRCELPPRHRARFVTELLVRRSAAT